MAREAVKQDTEEEDDPWQTGSGMADDFEGWIQEPFFGVDEKYNAEAVLFCATLVDADGEPITTLKYSVGADWAADDDGATITHPRKARVNNSARFGLFIDRLVGATDERAPKNKEIEAPKGQENGLGLGKLLRGRGLPTEAKAYDGLGFHWRLHKAPTMGKDKEGNPIIKDVLFPVKYIGEWAGRQGAGSANGKSAVAKAQAAPVRKTAAAAQPAVAEEAGEIEIPIALRKKLTPLAQSSTAKEFTKAAAKDKDVLALDDEIMSNILNPGANGFWASVQE